MNLMRYDLFKKLDAEEPKLTRMSIILADKSMKYSRGIIEDVLVKVDNFNFPIAFFIMDVSEDIEVPLIFDRPFLSTANAIIDVGEGKLTL